MTKKKETGCDFDEQGVIHYLIENGIPGYGVSSPDPYYDYRPRRLPRNVFGPPRHHRKTSVGRIT
ncbi:MAG: hypothetical protein WDZ85_00770 [Candidatus Paceibacterota bacterium]